jgi:hypothetical protein
MGYYLAIKKEWNLIMCKKMDGTRGCHFKWTKSDTDKYHLFSLICGKKGKNKKEKPQTMTW